MNQDISQLLKEWPYNPSSNIRIIKSDDENEVLQVRKPLGIEQYELTGRPDGKRPFGKDSALEHFEEQLSRHRRLKGGDKNFSLNHEDFQLLQEEALLNYYRYIILFQIGDMERTIRDTDQNLRICELVDDYCAAPEDRDQLLQYKPYILRVNAVARAMIAMKQGLSTLSKEIVEAAVTEIKHLPEINNITFQFEKMRSLNYLKVTLSELGNNKTASRLDQLKLELEDAVKIENYEKAAELRDLIQELTNKGGNG
ncbi:MAG: UvrB/UvrC motif-containing protein [Spirochaetales bacterium]|nr:UvrB/UvrC motif-containing protein [Spirochaetales bacterium]